MNSRLDTLQAGILLAKLSVFNREVAARIRIGKRYDKLINQNVKKIVVPVDNTCVYAQYTIEVPLRTQVQAYLKDLDIPTAVHYPIPLNLQPVFSNDYQQVSFP